MISIIQKFKTNPAWPMTDHDYGWFVLILTDIQFYKLKIIGIIKNWYAFHALLITFINNQWNGNM